MNEEFLTPDADLVEMLDGVFSGYREAHAPLVGRMTLDREFWAELDELGLVRLTGAEGKGGSGASWVEGRALVEAAVRHGVRVPLAENDLLAGWLRDEAGIDSVDAVSDAVSTVAIVDENGVAKNVPWAGEADAIVVVWHVDGGYLAAEVPAADVRLAPGENMLGEPRDTIAVELDSIIGSPIAAETVAELRRKSALVRAVQVSAALDRSLDLALEYVPVRVQFGRPIAKLQAVQSMIADIATEASLARSSTDSALTKALVDGWSAEGLDFLVAVARSCVGHAASVVVRNAHQVFGAVGTTREHRLHDYTRAALAWRGEYGAVRSWDLQVSAAARDAGPGGLWALIAQ